MPGLISIPGIQVRKAEKQDAASLLGLIDALAEYEKLDPPDPAAKQRLIVDVFGNTPRLEAYLAFREGEAIGYALILESYSSFLALPTLYLEDVFVLKEFRKFKAGLALFLTVNELAKERGCGRLDFVVLDWNSSAQEFYKQLGAKYLPEWQLYRLTASEMHELPAPDYSSD
jgi:GNAT superfamily N-acetyltransferase